jgi:CHAD domain-containing protein/phosphohistidine phosphatase SixA
MHRKPTVEELCKKYKNEDAHSRHVADMALALWDAVRKAFGLPETLRPLLRATALLHDIGYDRNPDDHHAVSARLILRHGAATLTDEQAKVVAAAVLLHKRDFETALADPLFSNDAAMTSAKMLGAILRIADGLDYGHCQNSTINAVRLLPDRLICVVSSPGYGGNLAKAAVNADLWRRVTGRDFIIEEYPRAGRSPRFAGILLPADSMADAVRKLLLLHYRLLAEQRNWILEGKNDAPLHEARLAIRRYRAVLKTFSPFIGGTTPRAIENSLAALCRKLSPFRDEDVWRSFLTRRKKSPEFQKDRTFGRFYALQSHVRKDRRQALAGILDGDAYRSLMREMARFPRTRLTSRMAEAPPLVPFATRKLAADYWDLAALRLVGKDCDPAKIHSLRKRCRAARYRAEFFAPLLGKPAGFFAALFRKLSDALGALHDADCAVARLKHEPSEAAQRLAPVLEAVKKRQRAAFRRSFDALFTDHALDAVKALWNAGTGAIPIICLARHASAADGGLDRLRPLTDKGIAEAKTLGKALAIMHCRPGIIASSPFLRALSTAGHLSEELSFSEEVEETAALSPDAALSETLRFLSEAGTAARLCVGHAPHLDNLARILLCGDAAKKITLAKASVCCIAFPGGKIGRGSGELVWYFRQKKLRRMVDRYQMLEISK